jgi:hypothetical protein
MVVSPVENRGTQLITRVCAVCAGLLGLFWLIQAVRDRVPPDYVVGAAILGFGIIALCFGWFARGRKITVASWFPFVPFVARLAIEPRYGFRVVGAVSLVSVVGFIVVMTILQRKLRKAAQPGVELDGPSARGLTP